MLFLSFTERKEKHGNNMGYGTPEPLRFQRTEGEIFMGVLAKPPTGALTCLPAS